MTHIYSEDGTKKVDIDKATLLGDVNRDLKIDRQGDRTQLWRSAKGSYFTGSCLDHWKGHGKTPEYSRFIPISKEQAKVWVMDYYGPNRLGKFGFEDTAEEF